MTEREKELTEELEILSKKYDSLLLKYDNLIQHFSPWVFTHPHMLPEGWKIEKDVNWEEEV